MTRAYVAMVALAAGCGHAATPSSARPARAFAMPILEAHGHHEPERGFVVDAVARTLLPCAIADERALGAATARRIACTPAHEMLDGVWVVAPAGLYKLAAMPASATDLTADQLVIPTTPGAFAYHGGWCVRATHGDDTARTEDTRCFDANGPTAGRHLQIDGPDQTWRESTYGTPPPSDEDPMAAGT